MQNTGPTNEQFYAAASLAAADKVGTRSIMEWEKAVGGVDAAVLFVAWNHRRYQADPNDVRMAAICLAEDSALLQAEKGVLYG